MVIDLQPVLRMGDGVGIPALRLVRDPLEQERAELFGRLGFYQARVQTLEEEVRLLAAPAENGAPPPITDQAPVETTVTSR
jgi:hypothetical protein